MPYLLATLAFCVLALAHLWLLGAREAHLVRSVSIGAPVETVFDLVGQVDRLPEWRLTRTSLPRALRISELSSWGEQVPAADRASPNKGGSSDQVQFRSIKNRESGYRHASRALRYESVFRLTPFSHRPGCHLAWDVRYRQGADPINQPGARTVTRTENVALNRARPCSRGRWPAARVGLGRARARARS